MENTRLPLVDSRIPSNYSSISSGTHTSYLSNAVPKIPLRKEIFNKEKKICLSAMIVALCSLVLMVADMELFLTNHYTDVKRESFIIKSFISFTTVILVGLMIWFHYLRIQMLMLNSEIDKWYLVLSVKKMSMLILELLLYCIHVPPIPFHSTYELKVLYSKNTFSLEYFLSFMMFLRLILIFRIMVFYNKLFNHAGSRYLGALNKINFNNKFMIRSYMKMNPVSSLTFVIILGILIASYIFRACERFNENVDASFANSIWVMMITFTTVGYGDIVPETACGRTVSICTGIFGAGCTALITAVLANALEFDHTQNCFHNFVTKLHWENEYKNSAAKVLQSAWRLYKSKKLGHEKEIKIDTIQLMRAIKQIRHIKKDNIELSHINSGVWDLQASYSLLLKRVEKVIQDQRNISDRINSIESKIDQLCNLSIEKKQSN